MKNINSLEKIIAKVTSYIFIPPIMNLVIFILYSLRFENSGKIYYSILLSFLFGLFFPVITFIYLRKKGNIINDDATIKEERNIPYLYGILLSLLGVLISGFLHLNQNIIMLWLVYLICSIILANVNRIWKISAHAMGVAIPLGASFFISHNLFSIFASILIVIIWARYKLKVHDFYQLFAGSAVGFFITFILFRYCLN